VFPWESLYHEVGFLLYFGILPSFSPAYSHTQGGWYWPLKSLYFYGEKEKKRVPKNIIKNWRPPPTFPCRQWLQKIQPCTIEEMRTACLLLHRMGATKTQQAINRKPEEKIFCVWMPLTRVVNAMIDVSLFSSIIQHPRETSVEEQEQAKVYHPLSNHFFEEEYD
jgi:hypothetical protein